VETMTGRPVAYASLLVAATASGCSVVLDWDQRIDAGPDPAACTFKEPNDTIEVAQALLPTESGPGAICPAGDHDFYRFTVPADLQRVEISVAFDLATGQDIDIQLYDPRDSNAIIGQGLSGVTPEVLICPAPAPMCPQLVTGDYILEVLGASPTVNNAYTISINITQ
jgi:hypothetical protein